MPCQLFFSLETVSEGISNTKLREDEIGGLLRPLPHLRESLTDLTSFARYLDLLTPTADSVPEAPFHYLF